jgi:acyl-CoA synthetase (AMP-forming)/AMP-acid ligase II
MRLGAAVTALNPGWTGEEAARQLADSGVAVVVTTPELAGQAFGMPGIRHVVVLGEHTRATGLRDMLACRHATPPAATDPDAVALLTHTNLVTMVRQVEAVARFTERDTVLALAPFFHVLGGIVTMAVPLAVGATVVTVPTSTPRWFSTSSNGTASA